MESINFLTLSKASHKSLHIEGEHMKKKLVIVTTAAVLLLCGCYEKSNISDTSTDPVDAISTNEEIPAFYKEPTAEPMVLPNKIDLNADPLNVVGKYLYNYLTIMHEDYEQMANSNFESFETKNVAVTDAGDGILITGAGKTSRIVLNKMLNEYSENNTLPEQAIMIRFKTDTDKRTFKDTVFSLEKGESAGNSFSFYKNKFPAIGTDPFLRNDEGNFELKPNTWCYVLMTIDDYSNTSILVWHENEADNISRYFNRSILDDRDQKYIEKCKIGELTFKIEVAAGEALTISDIWIFEYEVMKR